MIWNKIGYGTWPLVGDVNGSISYGKVNETDSIKALMYAFAQGINVFDTADFYGYGYTESLLGDLFHKVRNDIVLITKGGMISNDGKQDFSITHLAKSLTQSLARLKTDFVDVYMLHSPDIEVLKDCHLLWYLDTMKDSGLIKRKGISLKNPEDGFIAINEYGFEVIEVNYNLLDRRAETSGLFDLCVKKGVKTVIRTPLGQGILTGCFKFNDDTADRRNNWSQERVSKMTQIYKKMLGSLDPNKYSDAQNCLRFCLSNPSVCTIIPGMKLRTEVSENIEAQNLPLLTDSEQKRLLDIYTEEKL